MREILADAAAFFPDFVQRRGDGGRFRIVGEILEDAAGQITDAGEQGSAFRKTFAGIIGAAFKITNALEMATSCQ